MIILPLCLSFWIGSTAMPEPMYQYRLILPFDEYSSNVSCDPNFNVDGEFKAPINENWRVKANIVVSLFIANY